MTNCETTKPVLLIFNGAPRSGKDTSASILVQLLKALGANVHMEKLAAPLRQAACEQFGIQDSELDSVKDSLVDALGNVTPRQYMIWLSEEILKPKYGKDYFAKALIERVAAMPNQPDFIIVTDGGFQYEVDVLMAHYPEHWVLRTQRPDCTFKGDSREFVVPPNPQRLWPINNSGDLAHLHELMGYFRNRLINNRSTAI